ncbi:hypothetical protein [Methylobacterium sp. A54F]
MPDFSPLSIQFAFLKALLITLLPVSIGAFLAGVAILVVVGLGLYALPPRWKFPVLVLGTVLAAAGPLWQAAEAEGGRKVLIRDHARALAAETERADLSDAAARDIGAQAVRDAEDHEAALQALKDLNHAADAHPDRDHIAVPRDLARGLRAFRGSSR